MELTGEQIVERVRNMPKLPVIVARSMMMAQSVQLSQANRDAIKARKDFFREMGMGTEVRLRVESWDGMKLGEMIY